MKFLAISVAISDSQSIMLVDCDRINIPFTLAGTYDGFSALSPDGGFALTKDGKKICYKRTYQSFCKGTITHTPNGANADWLRWSQLMDLCPHLETDVQMWEIEVHEKLHATEFIPALNKVWDDWNWETYVSHCFPKFMEHFGQLDAYEGIKVLRHEVSEGKETFDGFNLEVLDRGYNRLWVGGNEIYDEVWHQKPDFETRVSHQKLAEFSQVFTNWIGHKSYDNVREDDLIYLDTSRVFKTRARINLEQSREDWEGAVSSIDNEFGSWNGFAYSPNHAFWFKSCNGNALRAVPLQDGDYEIAVFREDGRKSCRYQEFFS